MTHLVGGLGNDSLNGGAGNDSFVFAPGFGNDLIQSFGDVNTQPGHHRSVDRQCVCQLRRPSDAAMVQSGANVLITDAVGERAHRTGHDDRRARQR